MSGTTTEAASAATTPDVAASAPAAGATLLTTAAAAATPAPAPAAEAAPAAPAAAAAPVVPERYEFKAPEGITLDQAQVEAFAPVAKELGLTQDQAQKLVDLQLAHATKAQETQAAAWKAVTEGWAAETKADKDIGGVKFAENVGFAAKAIDKFGTPELRKALDDSGMGNHPAIVKFCVNIGKLLGEDTMTSGNAGGGGAPKTAAEILFPNSPK